MNDASSNSAHGAPQKPLRLGFIPLSDCAPLVIALEKGFFAAEGLAVELQREPSWANIRDKVSAGLLDGAQMLAGMPLAATLGAESVGPAMITGFSMSLNGNAITVSHALYDRLHALDAAALAARPVTAAALARLIAQDKAAGRRPLRFAMVYPFSSHNYLLRYWLASAGIDPDRDICIGVVPPPRMAEHLRDGYIDGYCVGEPWNTVAVQEGIGRVLIGSGEIWNNHPEKVFAVTRQWAESHPDVHIALIAALIEASRWLDDGDHREQAVRILARPEYLNQPEAVIAAGMLGRFRYGPDLEPQSMPDFHVFHRYAGSFPWLSHAEWIVTQMLRWGQLRAPVDVKSAAAGVYRPDLYRQAAAALGLPCPPEDRKPEGLHDEPWLLATATDSFAMGADRFFDGDVFDPSGPRAGPQTADALRP